MTRQIIWSWYTGRWWVGCYIWYSKEGTGRGPSPPRPLLAVPNVTAHTSTTSVPITVLLCSFNGDIKGLKGFIWLNIGCTVSEIARGVTPFNHVACRQMYVRAYRYVWMIFSLSLLFSNTVHGSREHYILVHLVDFWLLDGLCSNILSRNGLLSVDETLTDCWSL